MGRKQHGIIYGIHRTRLSSENRFFLGKMLTFGLVISAINFHENVSSLEIHNFSVIGQQCIRKRGIRLDIILDVDKVVSPSYRP